MRKFVFVIVILLFTSNCLPAKVLKYNLIDLGTLPGYDCGRAWSINNSNKIVGYADNSDGLLDFRAVLFDETGGQNNIDLGLLPGGTFSIANTINDNDQIVGQADFTDMPDEGQPSYFAAVHFDSANPANISMLSAEAATGINNIGQVIGDLYREAALFSIDPTQNPVQLGRLSGFIRSEAYSINSKGQIVGMSCHDDFITFNLSNDFRATLFDSTGNGNNIDLGTLGGMNSAALAINDKGQIVGFADGFNDDNGTLIRFATLFSRTLGKNINLGTVPGYDQSWAQHINNKGQIVGYAYNSNGQSCAVLFEPTDPNKNIDLNTLVEPTTGCHLDYATRINDNGYILCQGVNQSGQEHPLLLIPAVECTEPLAGDLNDDCKVNFKDFAIMAGNWLKSGRQ
jgi:probable HAF family extracellular repeat protein